MSLVVAYSGKDRAVMGGDRRSISFFGEAGVLEEELYGGKIRTDEDLRKRAEELGSVVEIADGHEKVWKRGDLLAGEVTELSIEKQRRRRIYAVPGGYILVDIDGQKAEITKRGTSALVILGNRFTRDLAFQRLGSGKPPDEASFKALFEEVGRATASVSPDFTILTTDGKKPDPKAALLRALKEDCREGGWELCGLL
ncbi:DUF2121 domain-containing protein [Methanotrichaceae archaeon M04Ac]|uniref:DUF2121 domain-containing protein n=1 Tax=Candidatus Methanocrinis alkalitolerans TaxID=3033395 RepID=A0ABT5XHX3_9EURY|nr:DUF2121 domain-containing protein [Candidatus Methanocrinis alkalitolerans]MCR3884337.1 DUF2121 domain-containing protein [Methanothrix sp.]MDF0594314.1 DUF2121 domain-containing protein [Candidatus Methanocrinis alkalitolerans]